MTTGLTLGTEIRVADYRAAVRRIFTLTASTDADRQAVADALGEEARQATLLGPLATAVLEEEARAWSRANGRCCWCGEVQFGRADP